jgi:hypothetical protein
LYDLLLCSKGVKQDTSTNKPNDNNDYDEGWGWIFGGINKKKVEIKGVSEQSKE